VCRELDIPEICHQTLDAQALDVRLMHIVVQAGALRQHSERMREYGLAQWTLNHLARAMETLEACLTKNCRFVEKPTNLLENGNAKVKELGKIF